MQEFNFTIEQYPGKNNQLADFLSRSPFESTEEKELRLPDLPSTERPIEDDAYLTPELQTISVSNLFEKIKAAQTRSPHISYEKRRWLRLANKQDKTPRERHIYETHEITDGIFWKLQEDGAKLVVPRRLQPRTIQCHHDVDSCAHPGAEETLRKLPRHYYWKNMRTDVQNYVRNCLACAAQKPHGRRQKAPLQPNEIRGPLAVWSIDSLGPYPVSNTQRKNIWIAVDTATKWVEAEVYENADTDSLIQFVEKNILARYGPPARIIMDQGVQGKSKKWERFVQKHGIDFTPVAVEHQRANPVERKVQNFKQIMRCLMSPRRPHDWERHVPQALFNIRTRRNTATRETPSKLLYGFELPLPFEWRLERYRAQRAQPTRLQPRQIIQRNLDFQTRLYPQQQTTREFKRGEKVLVRAVGQDKANNFYTPWPGPGTITDKRSAEIYTVLLDNKEQDYHIDKIKKAPVGNQIESSDEENTSSDEDTSESDVPYRRNRYNDSTDETEDEPEPAPSEPKEDPQLNTTEPCNEDETQTEGEENTPQRLVTTAQIHTPGARPDPGEYIMRTHYPERGEIRWRSRMRVQDPLDAIDIAE